jgi:hypothetical protein
MSLFKTTDKSRQEIERNLKMLSSPKGQAFADFVAGKGLDANPYTKGSVEYGQYRLEMHDLILRGEK